jgi:hypothetical protein
MPSRSGILRQRGAERGAGGFGQFPLSPGLLGLGGDAGPVGLAARFFLLALLGDALPPQGEPLLSFPLFHDRLDGFNVLLLKPHLLHGRHLLGRRLTEGGPLGEDGRADLTAAACLHPPHSATLEATSASTSSASTLSSTSAPSLGKQIACQQEGAYQGDTDRNTSRHDQNLILQLRLFRGRRQYFQGKTGAYS